MSMACVASQGRESPRASTRPGADASRTVLSATVAPEYSIVIPILDERETLPELHRRLCQVMDELDGSAEIILVDDGSTDGSFDVMRKLHEADDRVRVLRMSRNFGHQIAITAGLDHARGDAVVIMDGDLQDPPEVVPALAEKWREGFEVVYAVRDDREGESRVKLATASWFYRFLGHMSEVGIPRDAGDFRLIDRRVVDAVKAMPEHHRYLRGMFAWVGYDQAGVHYARDARHAGRTKFPMRKMLGFATDGIVSFSTVPLRMTLVLGFLVSLAAFVLAIFAVLAKVTGAYTVPGWASITVGVALLGGVQLTVLGVMGEYIARIHDEVKQRPLYLVRDVLDSGRTEAPR
jgi:polyisoprenyl-phosphate glycosyltransferase